MKAQDFLFGSGNGFQHPRAGHVQKAVKSAEFLGKPEPFHPERVLAPVFIGRKIPAVDKDCAHRLLILPAVTVYPPVARSPRNGESSMLKYILINLANKKVIPAGAKRRAGIQKLGYNPGFPPARE